MPRSDWSKKNKYWISKHRYLQLYHFCLQYKEWVDSYNSFESKSISSLDGMPHGTNTGNPTEDTAIEKAELSMNISLVERMAHETDPVLWPWILKGVTEDGITYEYLQTIMKIPCGRSDYYNKRRKFFFLLDKELKKRKTI